MPRSSPLVARIALLEAHHGRVASPPPRAPLEWILWENVAYLQTDERRLACYRALEAKVGLTAEDLARAPRSVLLALAKQGGMLPSERADKLRAIGELALEHGGKDLRSVLALPLPKARKVLALFPGIGAPGAEKILMLCGASRELALESNGLRVLTRLGYGVDDGNYARTYRSVQAAIAKELRADAAWLRGAHELLRAHGKTTCRRGEPACDACPLAKGCAFAGAADERGG